MALGVHSRGGSWAVPVAGILLERCTDLTWVRLELSAGLRGLYRFQCRLQTWLLCFALSKGCTELLRQAVCTSISHLLPVLPVSRGRLQVLCYEHPIFTMKQLNSPACLAEDRSSPPPGAWKRQGCSIGRAVPKPGAHYPCPLQPPAQSKSQPCVLPPRLGASCSPIPPAVQQH